MQGTAPQPQVKMNLTLLQYYTAVVVAEMAFSATATYCTAAAVDYESKLYTLYIYRVPSISRKQNSLTFP